MKMKGVGVRKQYELYMIDVRKWSLESAHFPLSITCHLVFVVSYLHVLYMYFQLIRGISLYIRTFARAINDAAALAHNWE